MRRYLTSWKWWVLILVVGILVIGVCNAIIGRGGSSSGNSVQTPPTAAAENQPQELGWLEEPFKDAIIENFRSETLVKDVAIAKDGNTVSLALEVNAAINEDYAKQLGDNFVRQVEAMSDDENPGKEIGKGKYDYLIAIGYADQVLYRGAKARNSTSITW